VLEKQSFHCLENFRLFGEYQYKRVHFAQVQGLETGRTGLLSHCYFLQQKISWAAKSITESSIMRSTILFLLTSALFSAVHAAENVFTVTDEVLVKNPPNFGMNFGAGSFRPWDATQVWNVWSDFYSCEPIIFRLNGQATGGDADCLEDVRGEFCDDQVQSVGIGYWQVAQDGFWNGAEIEVYRPEGDTVRLVRKEKIKAFFSPPRSPDGAKPVGPVPGEQRAYFENKGEPVKQGDLYVMTMKRTSVPEAVAAPETLRNTDFFGPTPESGVQWIIDESTCAPDGGSTASMKITLPGSTKPVGMQHQYLRWSGKELDFEAGKKYRCDIWLRQEGLTDPVTVQIGDRITKKFGVGSEWQKFSFEVPNDKPVGPAVYQALIGSTGEGTLWLDNWLVYEDGVEPFDFDPDWVEAMKQYRPGVIRDMGWRGLLTLDNWLTHGYTRNLIWDFKKGVMNGWGQGNIALPQLLKLCKETGAAPYLMTYALPTDDEIDHLMEYLGAPADTGYGKIRAAQGHPEPWTKEFDRIYVECANEMWNGIFAPQAFPKQPELAGKLASRIFKRIKESPWNTEKNFEFIAPSWVANLKPEGWTWKAFEACPDAAILGVAPSGYIGGWDGETIVGAENDDALLQANLFYSAQHFEPKQQDIENMRKATGRNFGTMKYEAGPGYALPNPERPVIEEEEKIQKTLALGTATLDNFMFVLANNGNANYFKMKLDPKWSTHSHDMIPHSTFLALQLRNRYCSGDLLTVKEDSLDKVNIPAQQAIGLNNSAQRVNKQLPAMSGVPLVRLYAFQDGDRYSFIALNRSLKETESVTIELPYSPQTDYTLYMLTGDPRDTNRFEEKLKITEEKKTGFGKEFTFEIPPASCCVLVNQKK
jgi:hypothetical protein